MDSLTFNLHPVPPFRLDLTCWALRRRARNIVDRWDGNTYRRVLMINGAPLEAAVTQSGSRVRPLLKVELTGSIRPETRTMAAQVVAHVLGLRVDLRPFYALAANDRRLAPLVERFRGLKPPRFPSVFETLVNAIACQQLSLTVGIELLNRLAAECGPVQEKTVSHAFPRAGDLLHVKAQTFRKIGFSQTKAHSLLELSRRITAGQLKPEQVNSLGDESAIHKLMELRGVGRWTAEYVLLRGLGRINTFPGDDVGARNRLARWLGRDRPLDYDGVKRAVRRWRPYAGLVYFHLLLAGLSDSGEMPSTTRMTG